MNIGIVLIILAALGIGFGICLELSEQTRLKQMAEEVRNRK
ncbi:hypothetical protein [Oleidesulfovibrio sp.]